MRNCALHKAETFHGATGLSWERNHEGRIHNCCQAARQDGVERDFHRFSAHHFTKAGQLDAHDRTDSFRRDIARADAGAASGQNQATTLLRKRTERPLNSTRLVRYDRFAQDLPSIFLRCILQCRSAKIVIFAGTGAIGNRDDAYLYLHL